MKKLILSTIVFFIIFLVSSLNTYAQGTVNLSGIWSSEESSYTAQQEGNNISITNKKGRLVFEGTITGNSMQGRKLLASEKCPNLDHYVPATGIVSADGSSIIFTFTNNNYDLDKCVDEPNTDVKDSITYTKTNPLNSPTVSRQPSVFPSPTPTETPLDLNGTWKTVNEMGTSFTFSGHHAGNSLTMQIIDASEVKDSIGKTSLSGTLSGHAFSGTQILIPYAPECLGKYFNTDGAGTVAADGSSITISFTNFRYSTDTCAKIPGTEFSGTVTYVRANKRQNSTPEKDVEEASPTPEITETPEEPSVGVSSKNFRELVRANAEYQKAQADLEVIKKANDPRWEDKKDFPDEYNSKLDEAASRIAEEQNQDKEEVKDNLKIARTGLERIRDAASAYGDIKDVRDALNGDVSPYGGVSLASDLIGGATDFIDLIGDGVSVDNAASKVAIDTVVPNALYTIPILKAADAVLNVPDKIANALGVGEDNWYRKNSTGFLKDHSISSFVKLTTSTMIETGSWTNLGGALVTAWDDVKSAQGFGEKAKATLDLVGTAVGAVPVAAAMQIRDEISTLFSVMKFSASSAGNYVSSWFTISN